MNISTATILHLLSPKLNETTKQKIETISVDGKVDLSVLSKDKGIHSLLVGLFKEIANGAKSKDEVGTLLVNQKQNFSFKNLSEDLKTLIKTLDTQLPQNPKLQTPLTALRASLVDIHTLDEKVLKGSISNSGVFLESKLANQSTPVAKTMEQLIDRIKNQIDLGEKNTTELKNILTNLQQKIAVLSDETAGVKSLKTELLNLFSQLKTVESSKSLVQQQAVLQSFYSNTQVLQTKLEAFPQVLFENNISKTVNFINDLKLHTLNLQTQLETNLEPMGKELKTIIEKINTQIDFFQLLSFATNSSHTYLTFLQEEIEDADIKINKNKDDSFSCQINLTLSRFGDLKVLMVLEKENHISINIGVENLELKSMIQENLQSLRIGINSANLLIQSLNLFSLNANTQIGGKNIYSSSDDFSFGVDIKV